MAAADGTGNVPTSACGRCEGPSEERPQLLPAIAKANLLGRIMPRGFKRGNVLPCAGDPSYLAIFNDINFAVIRGACIARCHRIMARGSGGFMPSRPYDRKLRIIRINLEGVRLS